MKLALAQQSKNSKGIGGIYVPILAIALAASVFGGCSSGVENVERQISSEEDLTSEEEKLSYALGLFFGTQAKIFEDLDLELLTTGIRDSYSEKENIIYNDQQVGEIIISNQQKTIENQATESATKAEEFLADNAEDESFTILDSGVRYKILEEGKGPKPQATDTVEVHYRGTLINGEEFDSSYQRNQTAVFPVNGVISGWQEALQLMPVGSTWEVIIPPDLAYGERGTGRIGPNEVLIFQINLIDIKN